MRGRTAELERQVAQRTAELQEALTGLEMFSYTVAHDLRAPLRAIQGFSRILAARLSGKIDPEEQSLLERISASALRMDRLTQDVLSLSRIGCGPALLVPVDLDELVRALLRHYSDYQRARIRLREKLHPVTGNETLLTQCLTNIINNALKFVPKGRAPAVDLWTQRHDSRIRLWVEDNGIGIDPRYHAKIFEPFERLHQDGQYEGTGIGLAIVKKAVQCMGGLVGVESELGGGSKFWIELPGTQRA